MKYGSKEWLIHFGANVHKRYWLREILSFVVETIINHNNTKITSTHNRVTGYTGNNSNRNVIV